MKKIYILAATALIAFSANAQFVDDFESYSNGDISAQDSKWRTWSDADGSPEDADVSTAQASNGEKSLNISTGNDMLLFTGPQTGGQYTFKYNAYLTGESSGFIGLMTEATFGFGLQLYHNSPSIGTSFAFDTVAAGDPFTIPQDQWVTFTWKMDLDADTVVVDMDGAVVYDGVLGLEGMLDAVDIWDDGNGTNFWLDEVQIAQGLLGADDFSGDVFSVFPNPVVNTLNIKSAIAVDNVTIYDVLGKQVLSVNPDAISPSVDMSALSSGAYLVNVTIGNASKTIKILK